MEGWTRPEHLASTAWLADAVDRAGVRIVDARWRPDGSGRKLHAAGHIPGAVYVDWREDLIEDEADDQLLLAGPDRVTALTARLGIGDGTEVIVYDDSQSLFASRVWWSLRAYGLKSVRVLDGGFAAWVDEGRPCPPGPRPPSRRLQRRRSGRPTRRDVGCPLDAGLAVRDPPRRQGAGRVQGVRREYETPRPHPGRGQCPGRGHEHARQPEAARRGGPSRPPPLRQREPRAADGLLRRIGVAASKLALVLTLLGHDDVAVYDGGWAEWGNRLDLPVDR